MPKEIAKRRTGRGTEQVVENERGAYSARVTPDEPPARPAAVTNPGVPLPEDFPKRDRLVEAGLKTVQDVRAASEDELAAIDGIGAKSIEDIREALA